MICNHLREYCRNTLVSICLSAAHKSVFEKFNHHQNPTVFRDVRWERTWGWGYGGDTQINGCLREVLAWSTWNTWWAEAVQPRSTASAVDSANTRIDIWRICKDTFWLHYINVNHKVTSYIYKYWSFRASLTRPKKKKKKKELQLRNKLFTEYFPELKDIVGKTEKPQVIFISALWWIIFCPYNYIWWSKINIDPISH